MKKIPRPAPVTPKSERSFHCTITDNGDTYEMRIVNDGLSPLERIGLAYKILAEEGQLRVA